MSAPTEEEMRRRAKAGRCVRCCHPVSVSSSGAAVCTMCNPPIYNPDGGAELFGCPRYIKPAVNPIPGGRLPTFDEMVAVGPTQPGDQCADTDGMALSRQQEIQRTLARFAGWATSTPPCVSPTPIATLVANDLARHRATARPLPARALRPHPPRGGLHCGPF